MTGKQETQIMMDEIYNFEKHLANGRMVEKTTAKKMYDIRALSDRVRESGRPLTEEEAEKFII